MSSGAQSWSVKGIDPKVREAAREAAARQGMTLGEYLSLALQNQPGPGPGASGLHPPAQNPSSAAMRLRSSRLAQPAYEDDEEDWHVSAPGGQHQRGTDPARLSQRIEAIERRTQLAVTGLDRAVSTIDRSVLGLAARIEDAEAMSGESADRIADALEQFRVAGDTLGGRLSSAEEEVRQSRDALARATDDLTHTKDQLSSDLALAHHELNSAKDRLELQVATAEDIARRAEAAASFLATELENRDAAINHKLGAVEDNARHALTLSLSEARAAAEDAARQAQEASSDALLELRAVHDRLADRVEESERSTRRAIQSAVEETRYEQHALNERMGGVETEARNVKASLIEEVVRLESEIGARIAAADQIKAEQAQLIQRIERAEAGSRETTAGLRQAAGAAIADLRNAQLGLAARVKQVEETANRSGALDLAEVRQQQADIADRLMALEDTARANPMQDALAAFEKRLGDVETGKIEHIDTTVKTLDQAMQRLADRLAATETTANSAIRSLEETVSELSARIETSAGGADTHAETEALRAMVEQRLDTMAQQTQSEIATQIQAALGSTEGEGIEGALLDVNRRLAAAERRQAQTIEAISIEIKRMSETVDRRLRTVENRNDDAAASTVREELARMATTLEARFDEIERREAAGFDRMGLEVGRLSERLEDRVGAVEQRSAQAIEHVGEQVARMAERFNQRHEVLARDLGERMIDSEERAGARVAEAIGSIMQRLTEVEEHSAEAVAPVQKAVSSMASRLEALDHGKDEPADEGDAITNPTRRFGDFETRAFATGPMDAAKPARAAPLPPIANLIPPAPNAQTLVEPDHDIYFAEDDLVAEDVAPETDSFALPPLETKTAAPVFGDDIDELVIDDAFEDDALAPPPEDDDPFWVPEDVAMKHDTPLSPQSSASTLSSTPLGNATLEDEPMSLSDETMFDAPPSSAPGKNDYLNAARKAAQAQSLPKEKPSKNGRAKAAKDNHDVAPTPTYSLRGSSRIVLWGAASAIALLIAGGAWYMNKQAEEHNAPPPAPEPTPAAQSLAPATTGETYDPASPFGAPVDETAPVEGAAPSEGASASAPTATPAAPTHAPGVAATTPQRATAANVVAGPLAPRSVSLEQAAQNGDAVAQYELGLQRLTAGNTAQGVTLLRGSADHGLAMAQYRLAKLYERGEGVPQDLVQARQWTERAAAAGNRRAMHDLGVYFARGEGATLDEAAAFRWFRQAAELGVADSQYNLGVLYQQGRGVNASPSEAMFWFLVASRQGDEDASARATALQTTLSPMQVEQARARAQAFRPRAASAQANGEFGPRPWGAAPAARPAT